MEDVTAPVVNQPSRRKVLKTSAVLAAAAATGFTGFFGTDVVSANEGKQLQDAQDSVALILTLAATAEALAVTHYYTVLTQSPFVTDSMRPKIQRFLSSEKYHLDFLVSLGVQPAATQFYNVSGVYSDLGTFVGVTDLAEVYFIGAYIAASRRFAELGIPRASAFATQTAADEFLHKGLIRGFGGLPEEDVALAAPIFYNVSDVIPRVTPFLAGGNGFIGPISLPTDAQITSAIGGNDTMKVPPYFGVF